jgi:hypothetical protein
VIVGVTVGVGVALEPMVGDGLTVGVTVIVGVGVGVGVAVLVGVGVTVEPGVAVGVILTVGVNVGTIDNGASKYDVQKPTDCILITVVPLGTKLET